MLAKIIPICVFAVVVGAAGQGESYANYQLDSHGAKPVGDHKHEDYDAYPKYHFEYGVNDPKTGDSKKHSEKRDGDMVKGYYTFKEADGTTRTVRYAADSKNGFNAHVVRDGQAQHPRGKEQ